MADNWLLSPAPAAGTYWQHDPATPGDWFNPLNWTLDFPTEGEWRDQSNLSNGGGRAGFLSKQFGETEELTPIRQFNLFRLKPRCTFHLPNLCDQVGASRPRMQPQRLAVNLNTPG